MRNYYPVSEAPFRSPPLPKNIFYRFFFFCLGFRQGFYIALVDNKNWTLSEITLFKKIFKSLGKTKTIFHSYVGFKKENMNIEEGREN